MINELNEWVLNTDEHVFQLLSSLNTTLLNVESCLGRSNLLCEESKELSNNLNLVLLIPLHVLCFQLKLGGKLCVINISVEIINFKNLLYGIGLSFSNSFVELFVKQ